MFISILKHLDDPIHLPPGARDIIMFDIELVLVLSMRCLLSLVLLATT